MSGTPAELAELYRGLVLDHGRNPRHATLPATATHHAERDNPLCGDHVAIGVRQEGAAVVEVGFDGDGCLLSMAAASLVCEMAHGCPVSNVRDLCKRYLALVAERVEVWPSQMGQLAAFAAVSRFPARTQCATLAVTALLEALDGESRSPFL